MLTIGQLASYAGVKVRAVRHYHAKGLLPEPERDHSGYRRYDAAAMVELIRIRTLAGAGVPLAHIRHLLHAQPDEFTAAIADIDARLDAEIRERQRHRDRIARLAAGEHLTLPADVVDFLDRLRALGIDERIVEMERDGWIPLTARSSRHVGELIARKRDQLAARPHLLYFYRCLGSALDRPDAEHLLVELADAMATYLTELTDEHGEGYVAGDIDSTLADLLDDGVTTLAPPSRRLIELLRARGWAGWTKLERLPVAHSTAL